MARSIVSNRLIVMKSRNLIEQCRRDEAAPFRGWDFSYLDGRAREEREPWNYLRLAMDLVSRSVSVVDMGTGGGECFAEMAPFPGRAVAIEGYPPNVEVARQKLKPVGVEVVESDESGGLPLRSDDFDLVLNRHSGFEAAEIHRILESGGVFLSQQVGGDDLFDLREVFGVQPRDEEWSLDEASSRLEAVGLIVSRGEEWRGTIEFLDVGAVVYFLRAIPWIVEDFSVEHCRGTLARLQARLDGGDALVFTRTKFLFLATKPAKSRESGT